MLAETAPAKINLALHVRARLPDGFHDIESLFVFAEHGDELSGEDAGELSFSVEGPFAAGLDDEPDNLVVRAARALAEAAGTAHRAALTLTKRLPVASGIGGGSADAAAALRLLNRLWGLNWPIEKLLPIAADLGSDVPACLMSRTLFVAGRGERLAPMPAADLAGLPILLVNPRAAVPTAAVFARWDGIDLGPLGRSDLAALATARNDLQPAAIGLAPVIGDVLAALDQAPGRLFARMSGSGATCFALFDDDRAMRAAARAIAQAHRGWWVLESRIA